MHRSAADRSRRNRSEWVVVPQPELHRIPRCLLRSTQLDVKFALFSPCVTPNAESRSVPHDASVTPWSSAQHQDLQGRLIALFTSRQALPC